MLLATSLGLPASPEKYWLTSSWDGPLSLIVVTRVMIGIPSDEDEERSSRRRFLPERKLLSSLAIVSLCSPPSMAKGG